MTVAEAGRACGGPGRAALAGLAARGLITRLPHPPLRYAAMAPELALGAELARWEAELSRARALVAGLAEGYQAIPRHNTAEAIVEVITGRAQIQQQWRAALRTASGQVRVLGQFPATSQEAGPDPAELEVLASGVAVRVVYGDSGVAGPAMIARRQAEIAAGEQPRLTSQLPVHLGLVDDRAGFVPMICGQPDVGGLLVARPCGLLDALSALFEKIWELAVPFTLGTGAPADGRPAPLRDTTTRAVLATGLGDRAIARRLGCSERTVQRHVQKITAATGAKTRFQAALHIGRRNWTP